MIDTKELERHGFYEYEAYENGHPCPFYANVKPSDNQPKFICYSKVGTTHLFFNNEYTIITITNNTQTSTRKFCGIIKSMDELILELKKTCI
ncbi:MAG: hypothetical protein ABI091_26780 [Ferruginibacter sp.]